MATVCPYDITQLTIDDSDVLDEVGGKVNWSAKTSAIETNTCYEFLSEIPFDYMDFRPRYLVEKITDPSKLLNSSGPLNSEKSVADNEILQKETFLAYCFNVKMSEQDFGEVANAIPNAILEDIIADVMMMKGQSM